MASPASTGPAGGHFEGQVGASYLLAMLVGAEPRDCLARLSIASPSKGPQKGIRLTTWLFTRTTRWARWSRSRHLAETRYPQTALLTQVSGVGTLTAMAFVLSIEEPQRFARSRDVGSYLGLRPKQQDSGDRSPQLRITKAGDSYLRRILVSSAHYIIGPFGPDICL